MPSSQGTFQDSDLIQLMNEELQLKLVSDILITREDFFLTKEQKPVYAGVDSYSVPSRSIGNSAKLISFVDTQGNIQKLVQRDAGELASYVGGTGTPNGFYMQGDQVVTLPAPNTTGGFIRYDFYARPNKIVPTASCAKITASSTVTGTTTFTVDTDLTSALQVGSIIDLISLASPFVLWGYKVPITAISSNQISVASSLISDQAGNLLPISGDYICPSGSANIAQVPQEFHPVLAQMVANRVLLALGDLNKYNSGMATLKEDRENALKLIRNRVEESPKQIKVTNGMVAAFTRRF